MDDTQPCKFETASDTTFSWHAALTCVFSSLRAARQTSPNLSWVKLSVRGAKRFVKLRSAAGVRAWPAKPAAANIVQAQVLFGPVYTSMTHNMSSQALACLTHKAK